jgi:hypothetical protein
LNSGLIVRIGLSFFRAGVFVGELGMQKQRLLGFLLPARQVSAYGAAPCEHCEILE